MITLGVLIAISIAMIIFIYMTYSVSVRFESSGSGVLILNSSNFNHYAHVISFSPNENIAYYAVPVNVTNQSLIALMLAVKHINYTNFIVYPKKILVTNLSQPITFEIVVYNSTFNITLPYDPSYIQIDSIYESISSNSVSIHVTFHLRNVTHESILILPITYNGEKTYVIIEIE